MSCGGVCMLPLSRFCPVSLVCQLMKSFWLAIVYVAKASASLSVKAERLTLRHWASREVDLAFARARCVGLALIAVRVAVMNLIALSLMREPTKNQTCSMSSRWTCTRLSMVGQMPRTTVRAPVQRTFVLSMCNRAQSSVAFWSYRWRWHLHQSRLLQAPNECCQLVWVQPSCCMVRTM